MKKQRYEPVGDTDVSCVDADELLDLIAKAKKMIAENLWPGARILVSSSDECIHVEVARMETEDEAALREFTDEVVRQYKDVRHGFAPVVVKSRRSITPFYVDKDGTVKKRGLI